MTRKRFESAVANSIRLILASHERAPGTGPPPPPPPPVTASRRALISSPTLGASSARWAWPEWGQAARSPTRRVVLVAPGRAARQPSGRALFMFSRYTSAVPPARFMAGQRCRSAEVQQHRRVLKCRSGPAAGAKHSRMRDTSQPADKRGGQLLDGCARRRRRLTRAGGPQQL